MQYISSNYGAGSTLDSIYSELIHLESCYKKYLEDGTILEEVSLLRNSIEDSLKGSIEATECLREYGDEILFDIKARLNEISAEESRMVGESPSIAKRATGRRVHEANCAAIIVQSSRSKLLYQ